MTALEDLLRPPTDDEVEAALARFAADVRAAYGERLKGLYLFGSRARGDHRPDSDADVAVVLADGDWQPWPEKMHLVEIGHDALVDFRLYIQPWPFAERLWVAPRSSSPRSLIDGAKLDARQLALLS